MESVPCNYCGSDQRTILYQIPDLLLDHKERLFTLVKCDHCGLVYQNPRPDQEEIAQFYPPEYESYYKDDSQTKLMSRVNQIGIDKRCRIITTLPRENKGGRLLDIGCATGFFIDKLRQSGSWQVWGVETSDYAVKFAREQLHLNVFQGELAEANFTEGFFDVVTLWDVLEHLPDPNCAVNEISRISKPGSFIVLRVPNLSSLDARLFGPAWAGFDLPRHYYAFSKQNLVELFNDHGYSVSQVSSNIGTYPTFLLSLRFWLTARSIDKTLRDRIMRLLYHPFSRLVSAPIFYLYGLFLLGSEITVVAKKR
jgi:SAM-dependent methyltransferase